MFFFNTIRYIKAIYYARRDVREEYLQLILKANASIGVRPSEYMDYLAKNYKDICQRKISHNRSIPKSYSKIIQIYERTTLALSNAESKIISLQKQLNEIKQEMNGKMTKLNNLNQKWNVANQTGVIEVDSEIKKMSDIKKSIDLIKDNIKSLRDHKEGIENEIVSQYDLINKMKADESAVIIEHILFFKNRLDVLYGKIDEVYRNFDKVYRYYWRIVRNKNEKNINPQKYHSILEKFRSFSNICVLCGVQFIEKTDIYPDEREKINTTIKSLFEYDITV